MKNRNHTFHEVAKACSEYEPAAGNSPYKNSTCDCASPSCLNCIHFTKHDLCDLDLYDKIKNRIE